VDNRFGAPGSMTDLVGRAVVLPWRRLAAP